MAKTGLRKWFDEKWVDISRPLPGGGWAPCGRPSARGADWKKQYPKCLPLSKARKLSQAQRRSAVARKRARVLSEGKKGKPVYVSTLKKNPTLGPGAVLAIVGLGIFGSWILHQNRDRIG